MRIQIAKGEDPLEGSALKFQIRSSGKIYAILIRSYHRFFHLCIATFLASCLLFPIHDICNLHPRNPFPIVRSKFSSLLVLTDLKDLYIIVSKIQTNFVPNIALRRRKQGTRYRW